MKYLNCTALTFARSKISVFSGLASPSSVFNRLCCPLSLSLENTAHVEVLLHVVHDDAVVSRRATSVVLVVQVHVGVRTVVTLPVPQVHSNRAQMSYIVEIEEEEVLHDDSLRRECGEVCVSNEEYSPVCDAEDDV